MKRSGETKDRTRLAFPMMVSSNVPVGRSPGADRCEPMPCGAKRLGIDCRRHGITQALLHAMRASIEFARARVLQASQRMTAVTPFANREVLWCRNAVPSCECGATPWPGGPKRGGTLSGSAQPGARPGLGGGPGSHRASHCSPPAECTRDGLKRGDGTACSVQKTVLGLKVDTVKTERPTE